MKSIRMTMRSRALARSLSRVLGGYNMTSGAILVALFAACSTPQPLHAQTFSPRDSAALAKVRSAKARSDSLATLSAPSIQQMCSSGFKGAGYFKNGACVWNAPLMTRTSGDLTDLVAVLSVPGSTITVVRVDTVTLIGKTDTVRVTTTKTVHDTVTKTLTLHDTVKVTTIVTVHDTVVVGPPPPAVASVSTSLVSRSLVPGATTQASLTAKDATGATLSGRPVAWSSSNQTVATVSATGVVTAISAGTSQIRGTVDGTSSYATVTVAALPPPPPPPDTTTIPPPPIDPSAFGIIASTVGPFIPNSAMPPKFAFYLNLRQAYADTQWTQFGPAYDAGNSISEYERPALFDVMWLQTGDTTYRVRGRQMLQNWLTRYVVPSGYNPSPHFNQPLSLYIDCTALGGAASCDALHQIAAHHLAFLMGYDTNMESDADPRILARVGFTMLYAEKLDPGFKIWTDSAIYQTLRILNAQGFPPYKSTCYGSLNYMDGLMYDFLTQVYDKRPGPYNAAILAATTAYGNFAWSTQWRAHFALGDLSFNYVSLLCNGTGGQSAAPDLNGIMTPMFGWLGRVTRDSTWWARGDSIVLGMQQAGGLYLYRQFSESFHSSYRYFGNRFPALVSTVPAPAGRVIAQRVASDTGVRTNARFRAAYKPSAPAPQRPIRMPTLTARQRAIVDSAVKAARVRKR